VKLPLREAEHTALRDELARWGKRVSSALIRVEATRACARYGAEYVARAELALARLALVPVDDEVLRAAAELDPPELRSLDALHLATALSLGADLGVLFTYDHRMLSAARAAGLRVVAPA
jgi:predicted nucleic acid-binding protein